MKYALGAVAVVAAVLVVRSFASQRDAEWQARVERETVRAEAALVAGALALAEAAAYEELSDSLALAAAKKDTVIITMIEELPAPPPDCEPYTAPRDSVIALQEERHQDDRAALEAERSAADQLRLAEAAARGATDSLLAVLNDRPRPLSPLIPSVGLGCAAGLSPLTRQADVVCGLSLSWEVKLF